MKIKILLSKLSADCVSARNGDMFETTTDNFAPLTGAVLTKGNGSLLCFARFMEREIARNKCG